MDKKWIRLYCFKLLFMKKIEDQLLVLVKSSFDSINQRLIAIIFGGNLIEAHRNNKLIYKVEERVLVS